MTPRQSSLVFFWPFVFLGMVNAIIYDYDVKQHQLMVPSGWDRPAMWNNPGLTTHTDMVPYGLSYQINSLGLRGPETTVAKKPGTIRVLMMGASETFGVNVKEGETMAADLQRILGPKYEVLNGGLVGLRLWDFPDWWRYKGHFFQPDVVVLSLYPGSAETAESFDRSHDTKHRPLLEKAWRHVQNLPVVRHALIFAWQVYPFAVFEKALERDEKASAVDVIQWEAAWAPFQAMQKVCQKAHARLIVGMFPEKWVYQECEELPGPWRVIMRAYCYFSHVPYLDFIDDLDAQFYPYAGDLTHPNAAGYKVLAQRIAREI